MTARRRSVASERDLPSIEYGDPAPEGYVIRPFRPTDTERVRSFLERTRDRPVTEEWFAWRYLENPYVEEFPMFVATPADDDRVVGIHPHMTLPLTVDGRSFRGVFFVDLVVDSDHRGQGLHTGLATCGLEYAGERASVAFCYANGNSRPILEHWGWTSLGRAPIGYRIQRPEGLTASSDTSAALRIATRIGGPAMRGYLGLRDRAANDADVVVERVEGVPVADLAAVDTPPTETGTVRLRSAARFLNWRYATARGSFLTYVAVRGDEPVAALVTRTIRTNGDARTHVLDVRPRAPVGEGIARTALLDRLVADASTADVIVASTQPFAEGTLRDRGFVGDHRWPLSASKTCYRLFVRPVGERAEPPGREWSLPLALQDTA